jgi:hypothetical protein
VSDIECTVCKLSLEECMASTCPEGADARLMQRQHTERGRLLARISELEGAVSHGAAAYAAQRELLDELGADVAHLRKVLGFYADPEQWGRHGDAVADGGKKARAVLAALPRTRSTP